MEEKRFLPDKDICREIKTYVEEDIYPYAIMLDGEWGCGKSFFVENQLKPMFEKKSENGETEKEDSLKIYGRSCLYISLYGVSSIRELEILVASEYFRIVMPYRGNVLKTISILGPAVMSFFPHLGDLLGGDNKDLLNVVGTATTTAIGVSNSSLDQTKDKLLNFKTCFFVFDDLERCCIPVTEVFGYINRLIERSGCKVLIVANEKECGKAAERNQELKMIAAKNLESFIEKKKPSLEDIKIFSEEQFGMNRMYERTKEKLIGQTIPYKAQIDQAVPIIVKKHLKRVGEHNQKLIREEAVRAMQAEEVFNLRLLQAALSGYMKFYENIEYLNVDSDVRDDIVKEVLYAMVRTVFRKNAARTNTDWKMDWNGEEPYKGVMYLKEYENRKKWSMEDYEKAYFFSFKFIHDYVIYQIPDREVAQDSLIMYAVQKQKERELNNTAYKKLEKGWTKFTDEEYKKTIETMEKELEEGKYPIQLGLKILRRTLFAYDTFTIGHPDKVGNTLIKLAEKEENSIYIEVDRFIMDDDISEKSKEKYKNYENTLKDIMKNKKKSEIANVLNHFETEEWSNNFLQAGHDRDYLSKCASTHCVLANVDLNGLVEAIDRGTAEDIVNVDQLFTVTYKRDAEDYKNEKDELGQLIKGLVSINVDDKIKKKVLDEFIKKLRSYEERMNG